MPRIKEVKKARKDQGSCTCGKDIKAGDPYKWVKKFRGPKAIRCLDCQFKPSDLSSSKMAAIYDEQVTAGASLAAALSAEDMKSTLEDFAQTVMSVAEEYRESADNIHEHFPESGPADEMEEKADELEQWASDLEEADFLDAEFEKDADSKETEAVQRAHWLDGLRGEAEELVGNCPVD